MLGRRQQPIVRGPHHVDRRPTIRRARRRRNVLRGECSTHLVLTAGAAARVAAFPIDQVRQMIFSRRIPESGPESSDQRLLEDGYLRTRFEQADLGPSGSAAEGYEERCPEQSTPSASSGAAPKSARPVKAKKIQEGFTFT